ncbi:MAG TPA: amino acid adenylation domain-containing protein, partial [Allosphingosinicella sp.]|nr:amino acid adenylation domain-containing protein [Allosphingosinicella sp.]
SLVETRGRIEGDLEFATALFDRATIERFARYLRNILAGMAQDPGQPAAAIPMLPEEERQQVLELWNETSTSYPRVSVGEAFAACAAEQLDAVALVSGGWSLTYGELDRRSDALAARLVAQGVGLEEVVGLCLDRSVEMVIGLLAIVKAGGAYLPLDPAYPPERLGFMIGDCAPRIVLTRGPTRHTLEAALDGLQTAPAILDLDEIGAECAMAFTAPSRAGPDNLAYVMYTSGSTGRPKGVAVTHRGVLRLVSRPNYVQIGSEDVFLQLAPLAFDASTFEIWGALLNGARLVLYPHRHADPEEIQACIAEHGVTILWLTAGLFHETVSAIAQPSSPLRQLLAGGDVVLRADVSVALAKIEGLTFINGYGPTECTTFSVCHRLGREAAIGSSVPIGRPISDTRAYVLDDRLEPAPLGAAGNLYIAGDGLARGYVGQAGLTAHRFIADPFVPGTRMYATGDRARWQADGTLQFLGRNDFQVKIRGFRVELGEIEAKLAACPAVEQAAVVVNDKDGDKRLIAHVVLARDGAVPGIQADLGWTLPAYMMPGRIIVWETFPVTPNGKVDRTALAARAAEPCRDEGYEPPTTRIEQAIADIWAELLGLHQIGRQDNFFELGGHSLMAVKVIFRIRQQVAPGAPLAALFAAPRLADLAERLESEQASVLPPIVPASRPTLLPLSFAQQRLWFLGQIEGVSEAYHVPAGLRLRGPLDEA